MADKRQLTTNTFVSDIKTLLHCARSSVYQFVNMTMSQTYWEIGRKIVEEEQQGKVRAGYGKNLSQPYRMNSVRNLAKDFLLII